MHLRLLRRLLPPRQPSAPGICAASTYVSILCWKALHCHSVASAVVGLNEQCARENAQDMLTLLQQLKPHMQYCNMTYAEPQH